MTTTKHPFFRLPFNRSSFIDFYTLQEIILKTSNSRQQFTDHTHNILCYVKCLSSFFYTSRFQKFTEAKHHLKTSHIIHFLPMFSNNDVSLSCQWAPQK